MKKKAKKRKTVKKGPHTTLVTKWRTVKTHKRKIKRRVKV